MYGLTKEASLMMPLFLGCDFSLNDYWVNLFIPSETTNSLLYWVLKFSVIAVKIYVELRIVWH